MYDTHLTRLAGAIEAELPVGTVVHAWRLLIWEPDIPLDEAQQTRLYELLPGCLALAGACAGAFSDEGERLDILLAETEFAAEPHRNTALWLGARLLMECAQTEFGQDGLLRVTDGAEEPGQLSTEAAEEISRWWLRAGCISPQAAHMHRGRLEALIKRRQYHAVCGYLVRALHGMNDLNRVCFSAVPLIIEAIDSQYSEIPLTRMTEKLNLREMTRRPKDGLLQWVQSLEPVLKASHTARGDEPIARVIAGIETDCSLPYTQANLSRSLGLSPAYFCRLFHERTGQHFSAFLTGVRMRRAQTLLASPEPPPLPELAAACGYLNHGYFVKVFRKYTGMSPAEYITRMHEDA